MAKTNNIVTIRDESREMMGLWPDVVRDLADIVRQLDMPDATKWMTKVILFNKSIKT